MLFTNEMRLGPYFNTIVEQLQQNRGCYFPHVHYASLIPKYKNISVVRNNVIFNNI